jgi:hypothetical protein
MWVLESGVMATDTFAPLELLVAAYIVTILSLYADVTIMCHVTAGGLGRT